ncbi:hypothetical protein L6164_005106 [Bauhinia variegata]|uniref:Uncharacterized protein n=1 Tax=Bauhinia variegata TaxID=167791 RepID=A0ACB9PS56_BAUVA|nr:hypothetical protein L6164_005106 [Bauhinia variegata]
MASAVGKHGGDSMDVDKLPEGINEMKIKDEKDIDSAMVDGNGTETGHIIVTTIGGRDGQPKQTISYMAERVVGQGSFGIVFQAKCLETGETVAIKKVLQDKRYKNRELQTMRLLDHPNVVSLKHCFFSTTDKDELYLNLVLEYVPETVYRVVKHYSKANQRMPLIYVKLYTYQICRALAYIHGCVRVCHRDIKPQNLLVNPHTHQVKLCDFGSAKVLVKGEPNISYICSRYYRAPELIFGATEYTTAIDMWSVGCVLAELLLGQPLFPGESGVDQLVEIIKVLGTPTREEIKCMNPNYTDFKFPQIKAHPWHKIFHKRMPPEAVDLVSRLLQYSPNLRCTALDACVHPFFDELRDPNTRLPNGRPLPPLFNFKPQELKGATLEMLCKLVPEHAPASACSSFFGCKYIIVLAGGSSRVNFRGLSCVFLQLKRKYFSWVLGSLAWEPMSLQSIEPEDDDSGVESENFDWNTEDELEIENFQSSSSSLTGLNGDGITGSGEGSSSAGSSNSKMFDHFVGMGFPEKVVSKVIQENGEDNADLILETLLTYSALDTPPQQQQQIESDPCSSDYEGSFLDDFSDIDSFSDNEEITNSASDNDGKLLSLVNMGYGVDEASIALERCGPDSSLAEIVDFICAAQVAKSSDTLILEEKPRFSNLPKPKKRNYYKEEVLGRKRPRGPLNEEDGEILRLPNPMIGFGVPTEPLFITDRTLPEAAIGPPYFYFENVALAPKGVWQKISRFLYDVEPEFVDSKYFCAAARKRGYVHNLPIKNRFPLVPLPPRIIHEALPLTRKWWPSWDERTKLNCLQTCIGSAKLTERIRKAIENYDGDPPLHIQKKVIDECRKWNLVWVGRNKVAPLEPDEVEMLLGFPKNHTRGGGISRTDRYKSLGNSFQVDTVAYHLSVLKGLYPSGINLLSLFSGIGGAEVALHRLGIPLRTVVSVEKSEVNRNILRSWWEQTNQKGNLIDLDDVRHLNGEKLEQLMNTFGGFDLVIGGSPCNNLTGSNRHTRDGLEGTDSSLFFDYFRILDLVKCMTKKYQ